MPRNSRIQMVGKLELRGIEALANEAGALEWELWRDWRALRDASVKGDPEASEGG
jgi:hypothetical protein